MTRINMDEWLAELERLSDGVGDDGETWQEIQKRLGLGFRKTRTMLRQGVATGRILVGKASRQDIAGRKQTVPVYRAKLGPARNAEDQRRDIRGIQFITKLSARDCKEIIALLDSDAPPSTRLKRAVAKLKKTVPADEKWLYEDLKSLGSVLRGLEQAKAGQLGKGPDLDKEERK